MECKCGLCSTVPPFLLLLLLLLLSTGNAEANSFCANRLKACPAPPTVDSIDLQAYLGKWYEIGSTASFKLLTEAGLVCNQALYSSNSDHNLTLLNSGLRAVSALASAQVSAISLAARGVCAGAKQVCAQLDALVGEALQPLSTAAKSLHDLGFSAYAAEVSQAEAKLQRAVEAAARALQVASDTVTSIQQRNGEVSQGNGSLKASVGGIRGSVRQANEEGVAQIAAFVGVASAVRDEVLGLSGKLSATGKASKVKAELKQVGESLGSAALKVVASNGAASASLKAIDAGAATLLLDGHPIQNGQVSSVTGRITVPNMASPGKLQVNINGVSAPYWIIDLEVDSQGGYKGALVYSCSEVAGVFAKSLFILSREPQLDNAVIEKFLDKAQSFGIYNDCDDPFLFTVQKGGSCGQPTS